MSADPRAKASEGMRGHRLKRAFDAAASGAGLLVLSPLFAATALAVKSSKGPVFYRQERVGKDGKVFRLVKFRSMVVDADRSGRLTPAGDVRITRVGRFIRKTNLDELPQLWNVLRGDLSLVGPRPEVPEYVDLDDVKWRTVLSVRPGMTSPETIQFRREGEILARYDDPDRGYQEEVLPEKLRLAGDYVANRTFTGDLKTIFGTFVDIVKRK